MKDFKVFITGIAGFIGFHLAQRLHAQGVHVVGIDSFNTYYPPALKKARAGILKDKGIEVYEGDIVQEGLLYSHLKAFCPSHLVHLAAYAGVRFSIEHPELYIRNNVDGFFQVAEALKKIGGVRCVYASSSSVYGKNEKIPFSVKDMTDKPANVYGMTKKTNELMAYVYHSLYGIPFVGLRFFTVYGPWGRPDMAYFHFTKAIIEEKPIKLFNFGNMRRDFTFISDIVDGIEKSLNISEGNHLFNLGNSSPCELNAFVDILEDALQKKAIRDFLPMPQGEIIETYADIQESEKVLGYKPRTSLQEGLFKFVHWYTHTYVDKKW